MPKIKFVKTRTVQDGTGTTYEAGKVYDLPERSCARWIRREVAEPVAAKTKTKPAKPIRVPVKPPPQATPEPTKDTLPSSMAGREPLTAFDDD